MLRILEAPVADRAPAFTRMPPRGVTDASEDCVAVLLGNPAVLQATVEQKKSPKSHPGIRSPIPLPFFVVIYLGAEDEEPGRLEECCALFPPQSAQGLLPASERTGAPNLPLTFSPLGWTEFTLRPIPHLPQSTITADSLRSSPPSCLGHDPPRPIAQH